MAETATAPTTAPTTPTTQAPAPTTGAPQPAGAPGPMQDAYGDLDRMMGEGQSQESGEQAQTESSATDAEKSSAEKPSPSGKPEDQKAKLPDSSASDAGKKKPVEAPKKPQPAAELRQAYEALKAEHKALKAEREAEKAHPREDPEKQEMARRLEEIETELKYRHYESSDEYKAKYEQPFVDAYQQGRVKASSLRVTDSEGAVRQGTPEDFDRIARMTDDDAAGDLAAEMFGNKAPLVLYHRERVHELNGARMKAIDEFKKIGGDRDKKFMQEQSRTREVVGKLWQQVNTEAVEKYPQWFKPTEGADDENEVLEAGFKLADKGFSDDPSLTPEQRVRLHSAIRNRAAGFGRVVLQNKKLSSKVAELEKELAEFKSSEPKSGDGKGQQKAEQADTIDGVVAGLDALAR